MEMKINGATLKFTALSPRDKNSIVDEHPIVFKAKKSEIYFWNCENGGSGDPNPRPAKYTCDVDFLYPHVTLGLLKFVTSFSRNADKIKAVEALLKTKKRTFEGALRKLYPTRRPAIPYKVLLDPWSATHSVAIYAQETFLRWSVEVSRPETYLSEHIYIQYPVNVLFTSEVLGPCNPRGDLAIGEGEQQRVRWKLGPWGQEMVREWQVGAREADKQAKEDAERLKKLLEELKEMDEKK